MTPEQENLCELAETQALHAAIARGADAAEALADMTAARRRAMPEIGILFKGRLVRKILAGLKTQTRRLITDQELVEPFPEPDPRPSFVHARACPGFCDYACGGAEVAEDGEVKEGPYGGPGRRLWVRETWQAVHYDVDPETGYVDDVRWAKAIPASSSDGWWTPVHAADHPEAGETAEDRGFPWRPAIHMPRWACRLRLEVTRVRVQRLQDITVADAYAEGLVRGEPILGKDMARWPVDDKAEDEAPGGTWAHAVSVFAGLWDTINEKRAPWASNPWVYVIDFKRVEG